MKIHMYWCKFQYSEVKASTVKQNELKKSVFDLQTTIIV